MSLCVLKLTFMHIVDRHDALCKDVDNYTEVSHLWQLLTQMQYYYTIMSLCVLKLTFMHIVDYHDALCMDVARHPHFEYR